MGSNPTGGSLPDDAPLRMCQRSSHEYQRRSYFPFATAFATRMHNRSVFTIISGAPKATMSASRIQGCQPDPGQVPPHAVAICDGCCGLENDSCKRATIACRRMKSGLAQGHALDGCTSACRGLCFRPICVRDMFFSWGRREAKFMTRECSHTGSNRGPLGY